MVAGNVETSQHVTNCLFGALGALAAGAGHDEQPHLRQRRSYQYYETICSGSPAGLDGTASTAPPGVHTHMTNSRLTDPEMLE